MNKLNDSPKTIPIKAWQTNLDKGFIEDLLFHLDKL